MSHNFFIDGIVVIDLRTGPGKKGKKPKKIDTQSRIHITVTENGVDSTEVAIKEPYVLSHEEQVLIIGFALKELEKMGVIKVKAPEIVAKVEAVDAKKAVPKSAVSDSGTVSD